MAERSKAKLIIRNATSSDVAKIGELMRRAYPNMPIYPPEQILAQIRTFPAGQFVAIFDGEYVGYSAMFRIREEIALARHTWREITGDGFASRHDPDGNVLYGMEVCVDPKVRGFRIGQRLYNERRKLCQALGLAGIVFGGRLPGYAKRAAQIGSVENYVRDVSEGRLKDSVLSFQLRNGFELVGVLPRYLPVDSESGGFAAHLMWRNPRYAPPSDMATKSHGARSSDSIRIGVVQFQQRAVATFDEFLKNVEYFVDVVADYKADFVLFPEMFTLQLLSIDNKKSPASKAIAELSGYTDKLVAALSDMAVRYNLNIVGGSHPTLQPDGQIENVCYVCRRDGSVAAQSKIHPTPNEKYWWKINGGTRADVIDTDCGPIGVLICYDSEFPELARHLVDQGALILFVPFLTDERQSYQRVRYCAHARTIENQCYVAMAGNVGNLPGVENADIHYAQSCILTPCDFPFAHNGVAADTTPNVEMVAFADLSLSRLRQARATGTVRNLKDRRFDLYSVQWHQSDIAVRANSK